MSKHQAWPLVILTDHPIYPQQWQLSIHVTVAAETLAIPLCTIQLSTALYAPSSTFHASDPIWPVFIPFLVLEQSGFRTNTPGDAWNTTQQSAWPRIFWTTCAHNYKQHLPMQTRSDTRPQGLRKPQRPNVYRSLSAWTMQLSLNSSK